jgi:colanic acid/amylovoran biosynthesis glycosyltransferase
MPDDLTLKVAYLVNQYPQVSHSFIRREIAALEKQGWEVHRFSARGWNAELADLADKAEAARTEYLLRQGPLSLIAASLLLFFRKPVRCLVVFLLTCRMMAHSDRPWPVHLIYFAQSCWLARALTARKVRHLHAHFGTNPAEVAMLTHELADVSYSFTVHGADELDKARVLHFPDKIHRAAFVIAVSSYVRAQLFRTVRPEHWAKIRVVHCGVDDQFRSLDRVRAAAVPRLVCVGRLCSEKAQLLLVAAAAQVIADGVSLELVLVGDGEMREDVERLIVKTGLQGKVRITGWADANRVREEILTSRAHVLPSLMEGLPVVLMEAMALGRPVISTYVSGIPELVIHGKTGWLVPAGDVNALSQAMHECLAADEETLQRMGEAGRERALSRHNSDKEASKLAVLFKEAIRDTTKGGPRLLTALWRA